MENQQNWAVSIHPVLGRIRKLKDQYRKLIQENESVYTILRGEGKDYSYYVLDDEKFGYYTELSNIPKEELFQFLTERDKIGKKLTLEAMDFVEELETACRELKNISQENSKLYQEYKTKEQERKQQEWMEEAKRKRMEEDASVPFKEKLEGAMEHILEYSEVEQEKADVIRNGWEFYKQSFEKNPDEDAMRKTLRALEEAFYEVYEKVFLKAENEKKNDVYLDFFLSLGVMDETVFSEEALQGLGRCLEALNKAGNVYNIYTIRRWLQKVYHGEKEPSKNEFDMDYRENLLDLKKTRKFSAEEEAAYLSDYAGKVRFEIKNMFRRCSRQLSGQMGMFCPILHSKQAPKEMEAFFLSCEKLEEQLEKIRKLDFSIYYRESLYQNNEMKIEKALIMVEVLPDIIQMPIFGTRGVMWQEIEGKRRLSPGRFMLPVFFQGNLEDVLLKIAGKYRWEICRTIQGVYWNNISEKSLTSEYYDYIQFFKKNRELNDQVKLKIKEKLKSCRNSFSEMFINDYCQWMKYESTGASKLNKVSRAILLSYCPFNRQVRDNLRNSPTFSDLIFQWERKQEGNLKTAANRVNHLIKEGASLTKELEDTLAFYRM